VGGVEGMISSYANVTIDIHHTSVEDEERAHRIKYFGDIRRTRDG